MLPYVTAPLQNSTAMRSATVYSATLLAAVGHAASTSVQPEEASAYLDCFCDYAKHALGPHATEPYTGRCAGKPIPDYFSNAIIACKSSLKDCLLKNLSSAPHNPIVKALKEALSAEQIDGIIASFTAEERITFDLNMIVAYGETWFEQGGDNINDDVKALKDVLLGRAAVKPDNVQLLASVLVNGNVPFSLFSSINRGHPSSETYIQLLCYAVEVNDTDLLGLLALSDMSDIAFHEVLRINRPIEEAMSQIIEFVTDSPQRLVFFDAAMSKGRLDVAARMFFLESFGGGHYHDSENYEKCLPAIAAHIKEKYADQEGYIVSKLLNMPHNNLSFGQYADLATYFQTSFRPDEAMVYRNRAMALVRAMAVDEALDTVLQFGPEYLLRSGVIREHGAAAFIAKLTPLTEPKTNYASVVERTKKLIAAISDVEQSGWANYEA